MHKLLIAFITLSSVLHFSSVVHAQAPSIQWQNNYGGSLDDKAASIYPTSDGGYIVGGYSKSNNSDLAKNYGNEDYWIIKISSIGSLQWEKSFGGSLLEEIASIKQTADGGYIAAGYTGSNDSDVTGNHGQFDFWVIKLSSAGSLQWQKCLGGSAYDEGTCIQQTTDGGYIVCGETWSNDSEVSGNHGGMTADYWVVKTILNRRHTMAKNLGWNF